MMSAYTERIREDRVTTKEDITMKFELARSGNLLIVQVAGEHEAAGKKYIVRF